MSQKNIRIATEKLDTSQIRNTYCNRLHNGENDDARYEAELSHFLEVMSEKLAKQDNLTLTENGALTYFSSRSDLVDFHVKATLFRYAPSEMIQHDLQLAFTEDPVLAVKLLFQTGDVRCGKGERNVFNACMDFLSEHHPAIALEVLSLIPEYTRWDYLIRLTVSENGDVARAATRIVADQFRTDLEIVQNTGHGKTAHVSLLGKWMPSLQTKKADQKKLVRHLLKALHMQERDYRHALSDLRANLNVIEKYMSSKDYDSIDMEKMTAKQQLRYSAFCQRVLAQKRHEYIQAVIRGEAKMNTSVLNPVEICHDYVMHGKFNEDYEALWELIPNHVLGNGNTLVVRDGSMSMTAPIGSGSTVTMLEAATALAIYCAERLSGPLKDHFITFSHHPRLVNMAKCKSLADRINLLGKFKDYTNTDIEATFDLILDAAISGNMKQEELPSYLLILSDMEFDEARGVNQWVIDGYVSSATLFETIRKKWQDAGYEVPTLVFWNLNGHHTTFPEIDSENGVIYLSGFSTTELTMVMSGEFEKLCDVTVAETVIDEETGTETVIEKTVQKRVILSPKEQLIAKLSKERYDAVEAAAKRGLAAEQEQSAS